MSVEESSAYVRQRLSYSSAAGATPKPTHHRQLNMTTLLTPPDPMYAFVKLMSSGYPLPGYEYQHCVVIHNMILHVGH
jgi:hypothetical protein